MPVKRQMTDHRQAEGTTRSSGLADRNESWDRPAAYFCPSNSATAPEKPFQAISPDLPPPLRSTSDSGSALPEGEYGSTRRASTGIGIAARFAQRERESDTHYRQRERTAATCLRRVHRPTVHLVEQHRPGEIVKVGTGQPADCSPSVSDVTADPGPDGQLAADTRVRDRAMKTSLFALVARPTGRRRLHRDDRPPWCIRRWSHHRSPRSGTCRQRPVVARSSEATR